MDCHPQLRTVGGITQLFVDGKPFFALGGELGNSTASAFPALVTALDRCAGMGLNTIMLPVYWDLIEPIEGTFDFTLVHHAIEEARRRALRLVPLWFGTWKNCMSCYAPGWVKRDTARFPRVVRRSGELEEIISPLSIAACEADTRAFVELMRFIRREDASHRTVIMVQVENEVGMIPEPRDYSPESNRAYEASVPQSLLKRLAAGELGPEIGALWETAGRRSSGSWAEVFGAGSGGEEVFTTWSFSTYIEKVAAAGKREYGLPMFVNAALIRPGYQPGQYASAGPLPHLLEVWRAGAPSLDMLCPDIYFPNFMEWAQRYVRNGNPLFIPEMAPSRRATGNAVYAAAHLAAIGFGPFAIESVNEETEQLIRGCYALLAGMSPYILDAQQSGRIVGLSPQIDFDWIVDDAQQSAELGGVRFEAAFDRQTIGGDRVTTLPTLGSGRWEAPPGTPCGAAMIIQLSADEYLALGMGVKITFTAADGVGKVGLESVQEGHFEKGGDWIGGRWLNGDQTHQGRHVHLEEGRWTLQRFRLYRF